MSDDILERLRAEIERLSAGKEEAFQWADKFKARAEAAEARLHAMSDEIERLREALAHALVRFECLEDHFKETGDEALWAMSSVDADRMRKALPARLRDNEAIGGLMQ